MRPRMRHNVLVGSHNVEPFSIILIDCCGSYPVLPNWWDEYEFPSLLFVPTPVVFPYYSGFYFLGSPDDIRRIVTLAVFKFGVLAGVQLLLYAAKGATPDYCNGSLLFGNVVGIFLLQLPTPI